MGCSAAKLFLLVVVLTSALTACTTTVRGSELSLEYYNLGNAYYDLADYDKSIVFFQKAISIDGENRKAYFNLALAFIAAGRAAEAQGVLEDLILQDPDNQSLMEALAFAY
jgi:tetratricopeptide (TPR) repeat protein